jgi:hypothetical protein
LRFDTMPSSPILQAWRKTNSPGCARCSLRRKPGRHPRRTLATDPQGPAEFPINTNLLDPQPMEAIAKAT